MTAAIVIPARFGSTRFPGKPLVMIAGKSLIQRVYERATAVAFADFVWVATDDERIAEHVDSFGGRTVMPRGDFATGTDRIAAAVPLIESDGPRIDHVVNLQGDEPLIDIDSVDRLITSLREGVPIVTLAAPLESETEFVSSDVVKVVIDFRGDALYFSRAPIPHASPLLAMRHIGIYGFQRDLLLTLTRLVPTPLEVAERLEQLRALQNGYKIRVLQTPRPHQGVDRPEDVARVESELARLRERES